METWKRKLGRLLHQSSSNSSSHFYGTLFHSFYNAIIILYTIHLLSRGGIGRSNHHLNFNSKKPIIFETQLQNSSIIFMIVNHSHKSLYIYYLFNLIFLNSINNSFRKYLNFFYFNIFIESSRTISKI